MIHRDGYLHVRGEAQFVDDVLPPASLVHVAVVGSPVASGKLKALHFEEALALPGVLACFSGEHIPGQNQIGSLLPDEELLATEELKYVGQPVAIVVAEDPDTARLAAQKVKIEWEEQEAIFDPYEAFQRGQLICPPRILRIGDVDKAISEAHWVITGECESGGQEHLYLETQRSRVIPREDGSFFISAASQSPHALQKRIGWILGLPCHKVEVDVRRLGGGFGGKEDQATTWACMAALAAYHLRRPAEIVLRRHEDMVMTGKRHAYRSKFTLALNREGKFLAYKVQFFQNAGAVADLSPAVLERTLFNCTGAYHIPNVLAEGYSCRTNLLPNTAFRGFGAPQGMFVIEAAIEKAAQVTGIPREELQRKNLLRRDTVFPYGQKAGYSPLADLWAKMEHRFSLEKRQEAILRFNREQSLYKKGYAYAPVCYGISFGAKFLNQASALVHIYTDGSVSVSTGGIEMGQGLSSNLSWIAARAFGISQGRIRVETTNTTRIANMSPSAASATTDLNGKALLAAIETIWKRLREVAARELGIEDKENLAVKNEKLLYRGSETGITWEELIQKAYLSRTPLSAHGYYKTPHICYNPEKERGKPFAYYVFGIAYFETTIDLVRGTYTVDTIRVIHELGRPLNLKIDLGQIEGGLVQGMGWMTTEEVSYNNRGELQNSTMATYKAPDIHFVPDDFHVLWEEETNPYGPYGTKAVGEPPFMYGIGVFFALRHALLAAGASFTPARAPLTPERVLLELNSAKIS